MIISFGRMYSLFNSVRFKYVSSISMPYLCFYLCSCVDLAFLSISALYLCVRICHSLFLWVWLFIWKAMSSIELSLSLLNVLYLVLCQSNSYHQVSRMFPWCWRMSWCPGGCSVIILCAPWRRYFHSVVAPWEKVMQTKPTRRWPRMHTMRSHLSNQVKTSPRI